MITRWTVAVALWLGAGLTAGCAHRPAQAEAAQEATAAADARRQGAAEPSDEQRFRDAIAVVRRLRAQYKAPEVSSPPAATAAPPAAGPPAPEAPAQHPSRH